MAATKQAPLALESIKQIENKCFRQLAGQDDVGPRADSEYSNQPARDEMLIGIS